MNRSVTRLLMIVQMFCLFVLMVMPLLIRILGSFWGKLLYAAVALLCVGFSMALRYALSDLK